MTTNLNAIDPEIVHAFLHTKLFTYHSLITHGQITVHFFDPKFNLGFYYLTLEGSMQGIRFEIVEE